MTLIKTQLKPNKTFKTQNGFPTNMVIALFKTNMDHTVLCDGMPQKLGLLSISGIHLKAHRAYYTLFALFAMIWLLKM